MREHRRRRVLETLGSAGILLAGGIGTGGAKEKDGAPGDETIVAVAVAADDFDVLVAALEEAGLVETLSGDRNLTVFAPTDRAFNEVGITEDNLGHLDEDFLADALTYHVSPGRRDAESVVTTQRLPTLNGAFVNVDDTVLNDGQADIVEPDIEASNGIIHVIDGVLLPWIARTER